MDPLRILLADDHLLFRKGLARLLDAQPDFEVVGEAAHGMEAVEQTRRLNPDLVLMDVRMPDCDGIEATRRIKSDQPRVRVVMLTVSDDEQDLAAAVHNGADGYLLKDLMPDALFAHLRGLMSGGTPMSKAMTGKLFRQLKQRHQPTGRTMAQPTTTGSLSRREGEVLALIVGGNSNREIAEKLGIAHNTAKNHLRSILAKLGVSNRVQAAVYAISHGLVTVLSDGAVSATEEAK
jgi:DNA-binding NarL/FixJ family response regulator